MTTHIQRSALLPYPAQALYDLVNDVASYPEFLPWCSASEVLESSEAQMRASLTVAKGGISQRFITRNQLVPGESIVMELEQGPFRQLHGIWHFKALTDKAVYALADRQKLLRLSVPAGTTVREVALRSGLDAFFPGLDLHNAPLGIFGKAVPRPEERVVEEGERVEIYRPLIADPKEVR